MQCNGQMRDLLNKGTTQVNLSVLCLHQAAMEGANTAMHNSGGDCVYIGAAAFHGMSVAMIVKAEIPRTPPADQNWFKPRLCGICLASASPCLSVLWRCSTSKGVRIRAGRISVGCFS